MKLFVSIVVGMAMASSAVVHANGTILLTRPVDGSYQGSLAQVGAGLFTIRNDRSHLKQLTPWVADSYYLQRGDYGHYGYWEKTRNFSPRGRTIVYFAGHSSNPFAYSYAGKYRVMDLATGRSHTLFSGDNDNVAPGYGAVAWGPAGMIAYANSANGVTVEPHCVYLMRSHGDRHRLWCAPAQEQTPQGMVPTLFVGAIRWAGNGKSLLASVYYQPEGMEVARAPASAAWPPGDSFAIYKVNIKTGVGKEIATNSPVLFDVSYDGTKVIYAQWGGDVCGNTNPEGQNGVSLCLLNLTTGHVTTLNPRIGTADWGEAGWDGISSIWSLQVLLSPDGSKVVFSMDNRDQSESDLYMMNACGTGLRQLTSRNPATPAGTLVGWIPVAWSADGRRILANRGTVILAGTDKRQPTDVHILDLATGKHWRVTDGYAVDWHDDASP